MFLSGSFNTFNCLSFNILIGDKMDKDVEKKFDELNAKVDKLIEKMANLKNPSVPSRLISLNEAKTILGISSNTMTKLIRANELPFVKIGKCYKINENDLMEWLKNSKGKTFLNEKNE